MSDKLDRLVSQTLEKAKTFDDTRFAEGFVEGVKTLRRSIEPDPMFLKILNKTTMKAARKFIELMEAQGFEAVRSKTSDDIREDWFFKYEGKISIDYDVSFMRAERMAYIGVRPRVP